jgi:hypothetical protein
MVTFQYEWNRLVRSVDLRGAATTPPFGGQAIGVSAGRWNHGTLDEHVTDFTGETLIDDLIPHTAGMTLTERWHLRNADTLEALLTIEDPAYFSRPWHAVVTYRRQPDAAFIPDVCLDRLHAGQMPLPIQ